jgi:Protein of unknown function (DUF3617)
MIERGGNMRKLIFGLVITAFVGLSPTLYAALNIKAGLWEITTTIGGQKLGVEQKCYLPKDIDDMEKMLKGATGTAAQPCSYSDYKESGGTITYKMTCRFGGGTPKTSLVTSTYYGDTTTGTITGSGTVITMNSKRVGNCTKSSFDK